MIVPMLKVQALLFHRDKDVFLSRLQELGLVHIHVQTAVDMDAPRQELARNSKRCQLFLNAVARYDTRGQQECLAAPAAALPPSLFNDMLLTLESFEALQEDIERDNDAVEQLERQIRNLAPWGFCDMQRLALLRRGGVQFRFYTVPLAKTAALASAVFGWEEISRDAAYRYIVAFGETDADLGLDADEFVLPDTDIRALREHLLSVRQRREEKMATRQALFRQCRKIREYSNALKTEAALLEVKNSLPTAVDDRVYILNGWLPVESRAAVAAFLDAEQCYAEFSSIGAEESAPVLLRNSRVARLFEPITRLFMLPQYTELDLTPFFAPFFALFFGLCLADAGYGLILLIGALLARRRLAATARPIANLIAIFGAVTVVVGIVTGNFLGIPLAAYPLTAGVVLLNSEAVFNLALIIGLGQVLFGMVIKAYGRMRAQGFLAGVSTLGWIILVLGLLGLALDRRSVWLIYSGIVLILLFNDLKASLGLRIGKGLWELYGISGLFGDVLSYIRLFALGLSGSILGLVFNTIAWEVRHIPYVGFLVTGLILFIGHGMNLLLGGLGSFVHPLRLTFVEFYKNAGFSGGGKPYQPFKKS